MRQVHRILPLPILFTVWMSGIGPGTAPAASAGDKEWATAGKILTGVVIAEVLNRGICLPPVRERTVVHKKVVIVERPAVVRRIRIFETRRHCGRSSHWGRRPSCGHGSNRFYHARPRSSTWRVCSPSEPVGAVVYQADRNRRLCQPAVSGHPAVIQERPFPGHPWISVGTHPSIW